MQPETRPHLCDDCSINVKAAGWGDVAALRAERDELAAVVRSVQLYGTGFVWRRPDGQEVAIDPAEIQMWFSADEPPTMHDLRARLAEVEQDLKVAVEEGDELTASIDAHRRMTAAANAALRLVLLGMEDDDRTPLITTTRTLVGRLAEVERETTDRCCSDVAVHNHGDRTYKDGRPYAYRHEFQWRRPKVHTYTAAQRRRFAVDLNRYPGVVIGIGVQVGQRVLSIVWGRPGRIIEETTNAT